MFEEHLYRKDKERFNVINVRNILVLQGCCLVPALQMSRRSIMHSDSGFTSSGYFLTPKLRHG